MREGAGLGEALHVPAHRRAVAAVDLEEQALEVRGDLDVHGGRGGRRDGLDLVAARGDRAGQDVVGVGRHHQALDGQAHPLGDEAGQHVAEISGRHGERDGAVRRAKARGGGEEVHGLRRDAGPVDGVDARELQLVPEAGVVEQRLHQRLAIVEGALDRERVDVRGVHGGHLPPLHLRDPPVGEEDEHVDLVEAGERLDGGAARVAGGRADDGRPPAARFQRVVHEPPEKLHGHVLEGERRAVEELQHEQVVADLDERADGGMAEGGVGFLHRAVEDGGGNLAVDEPAEHGLGHVGVGSAGETRDLIGRERRPALGHVEPAVPGEAGEHGFGEAQRGRFAAGGDVEHRRVLEDRTEL